jgi:hypothetical protein
VDEAVRTGAVTILLQYDHTDDSLEAIARDIRAFLEDDLAIKVDQVLHGVADQTKEAPDDHQD